MNVPEPRADRRPGTSSTRCPPGRYRAQRSVREEVSLQERPCLEERRGRSGHDAPHHVTPRQGDGDQVTVLRSVPSGRSRVEPNEVVLLLAASSSLLCRVELGAVAGQEEVEEVEEVEVEEVEEVEVEEEEVEVEEVEEEEVERRRWRSAESIRETEAPPHRRSKPITAPQQLWASLVIHLPFLWLLKISSYAFQARPGCSAHINLPSSRCRQSRGAPGGLPINASVPLKVVSWSRYRRLHGPREGVGRAEPSSGSTPQTYPTDGVILWTSVLLSSTAGTTLHEARQCGSPAEGAGALAAPPPNLPPLTPPICHIKGSVGLANL
ncbi:unnamed protein product [Gadus morhua 'NCC']